MGGQDSDLGPLPVFAVVFGGIAAIGGVAWAVAESHKLFGPWAGIGVLVFTGVLSVWWGAKNIHRVS